MTLANKRCMVIGGLGFIGYNIVKALHKANAKVTVVDDASYGLLSRAFPQDDLVIKSAKFAYMLTRYQPDVIFHFGSKSSILHYMREPAETAYDTIAGWQGVLKLQRLTCARLVAASSSTVYGTAPLSMVESGPTQPVNDYSIAKLLCERMSVKQPVALMRIFAGYGSDEMAKTWFASPVGHFIRAVQEHKPFEIMGDGKQTRDFVYIDDIVHAALTLAQNDIVGPVNVGTGIETSMNDLAEMIAVAMNHPVYSIKTIPKFPNYISRMQASMTRYNEVVGGRPIMLKEGIKKFLKGIDYA